MTDTTTAKWQTQMSRVHFFFSPTVRIQKRICLSKTDLPPSTLFREGGQFWSAKVQFARLGFKEGGV